MAKRQRLGDMFGLAASGTRLALEAQQVIALRLAKIARGGPKAREESVRMVAEKLRAQQESQRIVIEAIASGKPHTAPKRVMQHYLGKVGANRRRLRKET